MAKTKRLICASAFLLLCLAGCASIDYASLFFLQSDGAGRDRVMAGSLETVAQTTQSKLNELGFVATQSRQGDTIRIASKTATGNRFALVLTKEKGKDGEQTRVRLEWEGTGDDQTGFQILSQLDVDSRR
jgi:hypothetical protein